ncbi:MAG: 4-phosphoerythronate dehydrogenase PdxB [Prevotellaceae bacterium]|nr:4-phosphoerythronate dehydrogenase PdxB [Prevotellaceae bacterium]
MKAVVDDKIPFIRQAIESLMDEVTYLRGSAITASDVRDADVLLVRTRTRCDRSLLEGSRVRFLGTATIGFDHIDIDYLSKAGISWTNCPGCNANSVAQYVRNCLLLWQRDSGTSLSGLTLGIIGVGHVGTAVRKTLEPLGFRILLNDPPRQEAEGGEGFASLSELHRQCDIITIHTPLQRTGPHHTFHLVDENFLRSLARRPLIINTSRGAVVDNPALLRALDCGLIRQAIVDTWENEPHPLPDLLRKVYIGTPHIAGYSADGKANATRMTLQALCRWMGREMTFSIAPPALPVGFTLPADPLGQALALYNPMSDSQRLKSHPDQFEQLRGNYPLRREIMDVAKA